MTDRMTAKLRELEEWRGMSPEEQDALIASGWHPEGGLMPDLVWRATISGLLKELTDEVLALTQVVMTMNEKLAAMEVSNQDQSQP